MAAADQGRAAERLTALLARLGFWLPLLVCTYLALVPEPPDSPLLEFSDVTLHAAAFTYLTFALVLMRIGGRGVAGEAGIAFLAMLGYGLFIELVQSFVPERTAEWKDVAVDLLGIILGLAASVAFAERLRGLISDRIARLLRS